MGFHSAPPGPSSLNGTESIEYKTQRYKLYADDLTVAELDFWPGFCCKEQIGRIVVPLQSKFQLSAHTSIRIPNEFVVLDSVTASVVNSSSGKLLQG